MREKKTFRDNLELIKSCFPGKSMLTVNEVCDFMCMDREGVMSRFDWGKKPYRMSIVNLANEIS